MTPQPGDLALTDHQPWADLIMAGVKDVENRTWRVPSTVLRCPECGGRGGSWRSTIRFDGGDIPTGLGYTPCPWCDDAPPEEYAEEAFPFRLWIHAAQRLDHPALELHLEDIRDYHGRFGTCGVDALADTMEYGALLGTVEITGCHRADACYLTGHRVDACTCAAPDVGVGIQHEPGCGLEPWCSEWAEPDAYHWTLADPQPLVRPIPMRGRQRLWRIRQHDLTQVPT